MWLLTCLVALVLLVAALLLCAWLLAERRSLCAERTRLEQQAGQWEAQIGELRETLADRDETVASLEKRLAVAHQSEKGLREQFEEAQRKARESFKAVAADVLRQSSEQFLHLARKSFEGEQKDAVAQLEQRKQAIKVLLDPIREQLDKYSTSVRDIEKARQKAYGSLDQRLSTMVEDQRRLRDETANLVRALRRPEVRGRWGEMQLKRVAELAGMIEHCDFTQQVQIRSTEGAILKPDMVVHLPSDRHIVVDAKTPIDAFISAIEADDDQLQADFLRQHVEHIETQVRALSTRGYSAQFERSPDFVVLFIPGDGFLQAAVELKPALIEQAMEKGVIIATPSTLVALLKAVEVGWREQKMAENARRIGDLARELHERIATATDHVVRLGGNLDKAVKAYNEFIGSLESRVLVSTRKIEQLGAGSSKTLPAQVKPVDVVTRKLQNPAAADST